MLPTRESSACGRVAVAFCIALQLAGLALASPLSLVTGEQMQQSPQVREDPTDALQQLPQLSDRELSWFSDYLSALLREDPWTYSDTPLLYMEPVPSVPAAALADDDVQVRKRSRYYRRYPWKRVTRTGRTRGAYDPDMYMCNPTREDVFQLLMALHEAREGNTQRTVNFCNRKRPAAAVFTNIRFIGRRK